MATNWKGEPMTVQSMTAMCYDEEERKHTMENNSLPAPTSTPAYTIAELRRELVYIQAHLNEASRYVMGPEVRPQVNAARTRLTTILELLK